MSARTSRRTMRTLLLLFAFAVSVSWPIQSTPAAEPLLNGGDFEQGTIGQAPAGWRTFTPGTSPAVTVTAGGPAPSEKCLVGRSSPSGKLVALTKSFSSLQQRVQIEFSFAFSETKGRAFHIWTSEPDATDAGRLNLCVQNGELMQFDGRTRTWDTVTRNIEPSSAGPSGTACGRSWIRHQAASRSGFLNQERFFYQSSRQPHATATGRLNRLA